MQRFVKNEATTYAAAKKIWWCCFFRMQSVNQKPVGAEETAHKDLRHRCKYSSLSLCDISAREIAWFWSGSILAKRTAVDARGDRLSELKSLLILNCVCDDFTVSPLRCNSAPWCAIKTARSWSQVNNNIPPWTSISKAVLTCRDVPETRYSWVRRKRWNL